MTTLVMRRATQNDQSLLRPWFSDAASEKHAGGMGMLRALAETDYGGTFIAEIDKAPVGLVSATSPNGTDAVVGVLVVAPEHRGRRLGRAVLAAFVGLLDFRGLELVAYIDPENDASLRTFESAGFVRYRQRPGEIVVVREPDDSRS